MYYLHTYTYICIRMKLGQVFFLEKQQSTEQLLKKYIEMGMYEHEYGNLCID